VKKKIENGQKQNPTGKKIWRKKRSEDSGASLEESRKISIEDFTHTFGSDPCE